MAALVSGIPVMDNYASADGPAAAKECMARSASEASFSSTDTFPASEASSARTSCNGTPTQASQGVGASRHSPLSNSGQPRVDHVASALAPAASSPLVPLITTTSQRLLLSTTVALMAAAGFYWLQWWFALHAAPGSWHVLDVLISVMAVWEVLEALVSVVLVHRARIINTALPPPRLRVAMLATKVPSEPLSMLQKTLTAMLNQDYPYPYDVWLCDERPDADTRAWCAEMGVRISSREGVEAYHQKAWPRRTKCKEGNVRYFYETVGYDAYDVVAQFDADHVPQPGYLSSCLPAFTDPRVGYVACPSICGANAEVSWAVRGRLWEEGFMHGAFGASVALDVMPLCIGSHYVVSTAALKASGGIGPELNEDMSTSYIMTANGYKGAFGLHTLALGDGPACFEDAMRQEYQWSRSAMIILTNYLAPWWGRGSKLTLPERLRVVHHMLFWLSRATYAVAFPLLIVGISYGFLTRGVPYTVAQYAVHAVPFMLLVVVHQAALQQLGLLRPVDTRVVAWETLLHKAVKPYYNCMGVVHGLMGGLLGINFDIKVTPKGDNGERLIAPRNVAPLLLVSVLGFLAALLLPPNPHHPMWIYPFFYMGVTHALLALVVVGLHYVENHSLTRGLPRNNVAAHAGVFLLLAAAGGYVVAAKGTAAL